MMNNLLDPPEAGPLAHIQHGPLVAEDYEDDQPQEVIPMEVDLVQLQAQLGNLNNIVRVGGMELLRQMNLLRNVQNQQGVSLQEVENLLACMRDDSLSAQVKWTNLESWASGIQATLQSLSNERTPMGQFLEHLRSAIQNLNQGMSTSQEIFQGYASTLKTVLTQLPRLEGGFTFLRDRVAQLQAYLEQNQDLGQKQHDSLKSDLDKWYSDWLQEKQAAILFSQKLGNLEALPPRVQTLEGQFQAQSIQISEVFQTVQNLLAQDRHQGNASSSQYLELLDKNRALQNRVDILQMEIRHLSNNTPPALDPQLSAHLSDLQGQVNQLLARQQETTLPRPTNQERPPRVPSVILEEESPVLMRRPTRSADMGFQLPQPSIPEAPETGFQYVSPPIPPQGFEVHYTSQCDPPLDPTLQNLAHSQKKAQVPHVEAGFSFLPGEGFQPPPSVAPSCCDAHVQMVNGSQIGNPFGPLHTLLLSVTGQRPTLTQKHQGGWPTFAKQWGQHMAMVSACNNGRPLPDMVQLQYLKPALDHSDQLLLENLLERNPRLTFAEFWETLSTLYDRDSQVQLRMAWETVRIAKGDLTLEKWLEFLREFQLKRDRVEERTEQEEYKLLMRALPQFWQKKILLEEAKANKRTWKVRISGVSPKPVRILQHLVEMATGTRLVDLEVFPHYAIIVCDNLSDQTKVMQLNGSILEGNPVKCTRLEASFSGNQLAEFITNSLLTEQKLINLRNSWQDPVIPTQVNAVNTPPENRGGRGKPNSEVTPNSPPPQPQRNRGKGKSKNKPPQNSDFCGYCQGEGKPYQHSGATCVLWNQFISKIFCGRCQRDGRPSDHHWRQCPRTVSQGKGKGAQQAQPRAPTPEGSPRRVNKDQATVATDSSSSSSVSPLPGTSGPR